MNDPIIELKGISKSFGATRALNDVSLNIAKGAVHALVGENGAGKSTLMKIIMGIHRPDKGEVRLEGVPVRIPDTITAFSMGLSIVFQEIELCGNLSITENLFLGRELTRHASLDRRTMQDRTREAMAEVGLRAEPGRLVETLSVAQKQLVQIARAILYQPRILILDEPTSALTRDGVESLFRIIRRLHDRGVTILYISHKMEEIFEIADTVTVLKDGKLVDTCAVAGVCVDDLVSMMVGRELDLSKRRLECEPGACALEVEDLSGDGFEDVSVRVAAGEIVGIAGLVGSGRTELVETVFGVRTASAGRVLFKGGDVTRARVQERIRAGMGLIPEDRQVSGLIFAMVLRENLTLPDMALGSLGRIAVDRPRQMSAAREAMARMRVLASGTEAGIDSLSGGNQQKLVIGKWLGVAPDLFIMDEPTRGIDVGAKAEVHQFIRALADEGKACLVVSSELPEILSLADRIYVMHEGKIKGEVDGGKATEEEIMAMALATGIEQEDNRGRDNPVAP
jgi:ABC-type sugar transport system ATPase subunit